jgi:hypothetical protein
VTANVLLSLDQDHRRAGLLRDNGRGKPRRSRPDHHNIGVTIPFGRRRLLSLSGGRTGSSAGSQSCRHSCATQKQIPSVQCHRTSPVLTTILAQQTNLAPLLRLRPWLENAARRHCCCSRSRASQAGVSGGESSTSGSPASSTTFAVASSTIGAAAIIRCSRAASSASVMSDNRFVIASAERCRSRHCAGRP